MRLVAGRWHSGTNPTEYLRSPLWRLNGVTVTTVARAFNLLRCNQLPLRLSHAPQLASAHSFATYNCARWQKVADIVEVESSQIHLRSNAQELKSQVHHVHDKLKYNFRLFVCRFVFDFSHNSAEAKCKRKIWPQRSGVVDAETATMWKCTMCGMATKAAAATRCAIG